jgi:hypothetical protein
MNHRAMPKGKGCAAADAVKYLWYSPLQAELARRGRFMAAFYRDVLEPATKGSGGPFNGVAIDLSGLGIRSFLHLAKLG